MTTCKVTGCDRESRARQMCLPHYKRWQRHGDPLAGATPRRRGAKCSIADCDRRHYGHGWCALHYKRWKASGDPLHEHAYPSLAERFWARVDVRGADECWPWTGARDVNGYGRINRRRANAGVSRQVMAHRVALELSGTVVPDDLNALHSCDNPPCVNPRHLRVGTQLDNMADAIERGRHPRVNIRLARERGEYVPPDPPRPRKPGTCGTRGGYKAHRRDGEIPCDACRAANAKNSSAYRARRKDRESA